MKMYVKTLLVLIVVFLYSPIVNAQSDEPMVGSKLHVIGDSSQKVMCLGQVM